MRRVLFLLLLSPIFVLAIIFILIEDGFPIFSLEQSIGWDGTFKNKDELMMNENI